MSSTYAYAYAALTTPLAPPRSPAPWLDTLVVMVPASPNSRVYGALAAS